MSSQRQSDVDAQPAAAGGSDQAVETMEYAAMMRRMLAGWERRLGDADLVDIEELATFRGEVERALWRVVAVSRDEGRSWTEIGEALGGVTRQAAQQWFMRGGDR
jgi:hypothetical protein